MPFGTAAYRRASLTHNARRRLLEDRSESHRVGFGEQRPQRLWARSATDVLNVANDQPTVGARRQRVAVRDRPNIRMARYKARATHQRGPGSRISNDSTLYLAEAILRFAFDQTGHIDYSKPHCHKKTIKPDQTTFDFPSGSAALNCTRVHCPHAKRQTDVYRGSVRNSNVLSEPTGADFTYYLRDIVRLCLHTAVVIFCVRVPTPQAWQLCQQFCRPAWPKRSPHP